MPDGSLGKEKIVLLLYTKRRVVKGRKGEIVRTDISSSRHSDRELIPSPSQPALVEFERVGSHGKQLHPKE